MILDITKEEMAKAMMEKVSDHYIEWKVERDEQLAHDAEIAYQAVRDAATSMRLVPAVREMERKANEIIENNADGWGVFLKNQFYANEILKASLAAVGIKADDVK